MPGRTQQLIMSSNAAASHHDLLILGAGAAGLSLGSELKRRGRRFLILEQGPTAGDSWRRMPAGLKLVSPWRTNALPGTAPNRWPRHYEMCREEFHRYLGDYAAEQSLPIRTGVQVTAVSLAPGGGFVVESPNETFACRLLVNATGCFSKPLVPEIPGATDATMLQLHFADYRNAANLRQRLGNTPGPVLIVGKRLSAGQALVELFDAGFEVALSHRSPIQFGPGPRANWLFYRIFPEIETLKIRICGDRARGFDVKMAGGRPRQLLKNGVVRTYPEIRSIEGATVVFANDARLQPAAILYATGFRPALDHLHGLLPPSSDGPAIPVLNEMESATNPGLFFLGLDGQRNLQSRFLRGIRRDAAVLADQLHGRLPAIQVPAESNTQAPEPAPRSAPVA
jgi:cation diffusion facilitator CzcD-associated flavoprotein CzcO